MRFAALLSVIAVFALAVSCGGGGGRSIVGDIIDGYPALLGTLSYTFDVTSDPDGAVGTAIDDVFVEHMATTSSGANIIASDEHGRVWEGSFSDTDGTFTLSTDDEYAHQVVEFSVTGDLDSNGGSGTFTLTFVSGFGDDDGATVSGVWTAVKS
jgi:hypothetical protein